MTSRLGREDWFARYHAFQKVFCLVQGKTAGRFQRIRPPETAPHKQRIRTPSGSGHLPNWKFIIFYKNRWRFFLKRLLKSPLLPDTIEIRRTFVLLGFWKIRSIKLNSYPLKSSKRRQSKWLYTTKRRVRLDAGNNFWRLISAALFCCGNFPTRRWESLSGLPGKGALWICKAGRPP